MLNREVGFAPLVNEIIEAFGQWRPLPTIRLFSEAPHQFPRSITRES